MRAAERGRAPVDPPRVPRRVSEPRCGLYEGAIQDVTFSRGTKLITGVAPTDFNFNHAMADAVQTQGKKENNSRSHTRQLVRRLARDRATEPGQIRRTERV